MDDDRGMKPWERGDQGRQGGRDGGRDGSQGQFGWDKGDDNQQQSWPPSGREERGGGGSWGKPTWGQGAPRDRQDSKGRDDQFGGYDDTGFGDKRGGNSSGSILAVV